MFSSSQTQNENTMKISVTRALKMLKTLESRIHKLTEFKTYVTFSTGGKRKNISHYAQESIDDSQKNLQRLKDLIALRDAVKEAILKANMNFLSIEGVGTHTVAFWIEKNRSLDQIEGHVKNALAKQLTTAQHKVEVENNRHENVIAELLSKQFSGSGTSSAGAQNSIVNSYWDSHKVEVVDPADIGKYVEDLGNRNEKIRDEIDTALQENNAQTMIEVSKPSSLVL